MLKQGWREVVLHAVDEHVSGRSDSLDLLSRLLEQQDNAKETLRRKGYGVTGTPWPEVVGEVPESC